MSVSRNQPLKLIVYRQRLNHKHHITHLPIFKSNLHHHGRPDTKRGKSTDVEAINAECDPRLGAHHLVLRIGLFGTAIRTTVLGGYTAHPSASEGQGGKE